MPKYDEELVEKFLKAYDAWEEHWIASSASCAGCDPINKPLLADHMVLARSKLISLRDTNDEPVR